MKTTAAEGRLGMGLSYGERLRSIIADFKAATAVEMLPRSGATTKPTTVKPTTVTPTTLAPTKVAPTMVKPTTVKPTMPKNVQERPRASKNVQERPTKVTPTRVIPTSATQDMDAALWLQEDKCHAFADSKIPKWDPAFKTSSLKKAKAKMPKTYLELVLVKEVLDSINKRMSDGRNSNENLERMSAALRDANDVVCDVTSMWDVGGDEALYYEFESLRCRRQS
jgi:hypothetical protein